MKVSIGTIIFVVAMTILVSCAGSGGDAERVAQGVRNQNSFLVGRDWQSLYETCPPDFRANTNFESHRDQAALGLSMLEITATELDVLEVTDIQIRVEEDQAYASYTLRVDGNPVDTRKDEHWVKVRQNWYQDCDQ